MTRHSIFRLERAQFIARRALAAGLLMICMCAQAGTFGTVVSIRGHTADIVLDEPRGALYIANFGANRIEVMSLAKRTIGTAMNVAPQPGSMALSPDGQFLLIAHFGNFLPPSSANNALTLINLTTNGKQTLTLGDPPLGVAFGKDGRALVVTTKEFLLFDPVSGHMQTIDTIAGVTARTLPVPPATFPPQIMAASVTASADGNWIYGLTDTIRFRYDVLNTFVSSAGYTADPPQGPRTVSVSRDGSYFTAGWGLFDSIGRLLSEFRNPSGQLNVGSHVIDSESRLIYAQIPQGQAQSPSASPGPANAPPVLMIVDSDNLTVRERLQLPENLAGRSVLNAARDTMYSASDSGVLILPVGSLNAAHRVVASREDLIFRGNYCDRRQAGKQFTVSDPSGGHTDFSISTTTSGITVSPASGTTPQTVTVTADPHAFGDQLGTITAFLQIQSQGAINIPAPVRVLVNNRAPEQRGMVIDIPGTLVDILADPTQDRIFVLRQDKNQIQVFDATTYRQIAVLRTANTPTQLAVTFDRRYLLVGHDDSQFAYVYDLDTLDPLVPVVFPTGHYPRSIASSGNATLAASRVAGPAHTIDRMNLTSRTASTLPTLGIFQNNINLNTALTAPANGATILAAMADGTVMLYDASADTFTTGRKDFSALSGAYAASDHDLFVVDNHVLDSSLVPTNDLESATGASSGFVFVDQWGYRTTSVASQSPGVLQRVALDPINGVRPTGMAEAPLMGAVGAVFTHTLVTLASRMALVSLTTSGFTALSWDFDASVAPPHIQSVVNAADNTEPVASGGLVTVRGTHLSPLNVATSEIPVPTALAETCLTVNGIPLPMLFASPNQINAQLPFEVDGNATMVLHTPGGTSNNFNFTILPTAPSVFRSGTAGPDIGIATVVRASNNMLATLSNPIHRGDTIVIYATGLGRTIPPVNTGFASPQGQLARVVTQPDVSLGGVPLPVLFAGLVPGEVGVYQINATVPDWTPKGMSIPLKITQGSSSTTVMMRVVD